MENIKVELKFDHVISFGKLVNLKTEDGKEDIVRNIKWSTPSGLTYLNGYSIRRCLSDTRADSNFKNCYVDFSIEMSNYFKAPMFFGRIYQNEELIKSVCCTNSTATCKKIIKFLDIPTKGKVVGNMYFGMYRADYKIEVTKLQQKRGDGNHQEEQEEQNVCCSVMIDSARNRQSNWLGVIHFGRQILDDPEFIKILGKTRCYIRPGYHCQRSIKLVNETFITLNLKIEEIDHHPVYRAYTEEEPFINISSPSISKCTKEALQVLAVTSKKHWTGFEYFGFMKSQVMERLTQIDKPNDYSFQDEDKDSESEDLYNDEILQTLHNVRKRNAGATRSLCPKAIKSRNEFIHNLVKYASFNDVESKFSVTAE